METEMYTDFVNDECGDTMWDKVLAQKENLKMLNTMEEQRPPLPPFDMEFDENGLMRKRFASINDLAIEEKDRKLT